MACFSATKQSRETLANSLVEPLKKQENMTNDKIRNHLIFFEQNIVNLSDQELYFKIDQYFDRTIFLNNIDFLESNSLIVEDDSRNSIYSITDKGKKFLKQILEEEEYIAEKERIEFEKSKIDLDLARKMLKEYPYTKWFARIGFVIAIILAVLEIIQWKNK